MNSVNSHKILGIDPGYDRLGWAIAENNNDFKILNFGCIQTQNKVDLTQRYQQILTDLNKIILKFKPQVLAIETLLFSNNRKTAIRVAEAKGLIIAICLQNNLKIFEYNPNQIKLSLTGDGAATKAAIKKMLELELKINTKKQLDDALDAIAVAYTHHLLSR